MQIRAITVNAAGLAQNREFQGNIPQVQPEKNWFEPECRVTISREGRELSRTAQEERELSSQQTARQAEGCAQGIQNVEAGHTLTGRREEYPGLKKVMEDAYKKLGYKGDELRERVETYYEDFCRTNPFRGGIQQIMAEDPTEEELAAMNERAGQSKEHLNEIFKSLTSADFEDAVPLMFDYTAVLPDMPENRSLE